MASGYILLFALFVFGGQAQYNGQQQAPLAQQTVVANANVNVSIADLQSKQAKVVLAQLHRIEWRRSIARAASPRTPADLT